MTARTPQVKIDVDIGKAAKRLTKIQQKIEQDIPLTLKEAAEGGRDYARTKAPYWSGATFRNIRTRRGQDNHQYSVVAQNPTASRSDGFNLIEWMHLSKGMTPAGKRLVKTKQGFRFVDGAGGGRHIRSGDPQFMFTTADWLRQVAPQRVQGAVKKITLETR